MHKSNWNYPTKMWIGENRIKDLALACKTMGILKPLFVTDIGLSKSDIVLDALNNCLLYTSPSPRDATLSRMPSSA